ncbi:MAG: hypothetical protein Q4D06_06845 [Coriobacteriia bacterium]|nr:hypothetical protein [Coriobacteriia bacterium]
MRVDRDDSAIRDNDQYFRMGAAVAVGELYDEGRLGDPNKVQGETQVFLASFGIESLQDVRDLGITGPYLRDFERIFGVA